MERLCSALIDSGTACWDIRWHVGFFAIFMGFSGSLALNLEVYLGSWGAGGTSQAFGKGTWDLGTCNGSPLGHDNVEYITPLELSRIGESTASCSIRTLLFCEYKY